MDSAASFINHFNLAVFLLFITLYAYQIVYMFISFKAKKKLRSESGRDPGRLHKFAVTIAARNEELVIGQLIQSIKNQNYPGELIDIFVVADNCTDYTARAAREAGAVVRERFSKNRIGKGYALNYIFQAIEKDYASNQYDAYLVFDADNLLDENYAARMNDVFNEGYRVITSYRNSKNFDQNWISSGYALWFMHEAEYLNLPRIFTNNSCAVSGTGFLVDADLIKENGGWIHHLLTEDIEFSVSQVIKGDKIGYCRDAVFYDEQPVTFKQSWTQRLRWAKGFYQVFGRYGKNLFRSIFKGKQNKFSCYDLAMTIFPALLLSFLSIVVNGSFFLAGIFEFMEAEETMKATMTAMFQSLGWMYGILFILGFLTTLTEWKEIHCPGWKKVAYTVTFPLFMLTYVPIAAAALFKDVQWKPIAHTVVKSVDDVR
ncbi:glycosyltransferase family 2 protein [Salibacterium halotolerans]|uniref:Glycosyltransferase, catalytic subunit of cellulose synthase and poly-beta-1,6-N-acetylglucosamine synthase n=1 Tax=Salibacterium halotolerans TaxID=1884432 RepID=A0A1I5SW77_9BACI|nr:glycosyltransferase family 2 protein [Salibacterium halotolerans]SFP74978.1 Glycosyltransferase, catalytic subunit of cellulose synthase and poly-beta-1,6-N-acetylglucosamine synthase [Salibacterium halotolerans]